MSAETADLRERVCRLPGMERILSALDGLSPAFLVGGAVRDIIRRGGAVDLDLAVDGDAPATGRVLAERLSGTIVQHERFGTATVRAQDLIFDLAATRSEEYERPGALPTVRHTGLPEDLRRRDFTVNAMAIGLTGDDLGHLYDPCGGVDDLRSGVVRVLHEHSFADDPTRLLRAVRYETRLGSRMDDESERLARTAVAQEALSTVSGARVRDELMDLLGELEAPGGVERLRELGIDQALHPALAADPDLVASAALGAFAIGADRSLSALAAMCSRAPEQLDDWLGELGLPAPKRDAVRRAARSAPMLAIALRGSPKPSEVHRLLRGEPPEALALALAMQAPSETVLQWVTGLGLVRLEISGEDLVQAGVREGPAIGRALEETLRHKLDGELGGREAELQLALKLARGEEL